MKIYNYLKNKFILIIISFLLLYFYLFRINNIELIYKISIITLLFYKLIERLLFFRKYLISKEKILIVIEKNNILFVLDILYALLIIIIIIFLYFANIKSFGSNLSIIVILIHFCNYIISDRYQIWYEDKVYLFGKYYLYKNILKIKNLNDKIEIKLKDSKEYLPIYFKKKKINIYFNNLKDSINNFNIIFE